MSECIKTIWRVGYFKLFGFGGDVVDSNYIDTGR